MLEVVAAQRTSSLIEIELKLTDTETIHALALGPFTPKAGDKLAVSLAPEFVFTAPQTDTV